MRKDYGGRYSSVTGKRQKVSKRSGGRGTKGKRSDWIWQVTGFVTLTGLALGTVFSLWLSQQVRYSLQELASRQETLQSLRKTNHQLQEQSAQLQSEDRILAAAREMGLFPPTEGQTKRP